MNVTLQNTLYFSGSHIWYFRHNELTNELTKFVQIWFCCSCFRYHWSPTAALAEWHDSRRSVGEHRCSVCAGEAPPAPGRGVGGLLLPAGNSQIAEGVPLPTYPGGSTWSKTTGGFKKGWEVLTPTLKWVCANLSADTKLQAVASYNKVPPGWRLVLLGKQRVFQCRYNTSHGAYLHHWSQHRALQRPSFPEM